MSAKEVVARITGAGGLTIADLREKRKNNASEGFSIWGYLAKTVQERLESTPSPKFSN